MPHQYKKIMCEVCENWMRSDNYNRHMKIHKDIFNLSKVDAIDLVILLFSQSDVPCTVQSIILKWIFADVIDPKAPKIGLLFTSRKFVLSTSSRNNWSLK